jgi:hypothetical protein
LGVRGDFPKFFFPKLKKNFSPPTEWCLHSPWSTVSMNCLHFRFEFSFSKKNF